MRYDNMKNSLNHFLMIMTCLSTFLIACDDEGSSGGDTAGEAAAGEAAAGEAAAGPAFFLAVSWFFSWS